MSHSYSQSYIHLVFSTKNRVQCIRKDIQPRLWAYMASIFRNHDIFTEIVGGIDDHVHLLYRLPAALALAKSVYWVKTSSSKWMKQFVPDFDWQEGYGGFGVSVSNLKACDQIYWYSGQLPQKISFQQEYLALLKKHNVEYDPRYVFG